MVVLAVLKMAEYYCYLLTYKNHNMKVTHTSSGIDGPPSHSEDELQGCSIGDAGSEPNQMKLVYTKTKQKTLHDDNL